MAACGGGSGAGTPSPSPQDSSASPSPDAGALFDPDADIFISCADDPRAERYVAGMQKTGAKGQTIVTLLSSDPGPPIKGNNVWKVLVTDAQSAPQTGANLTIYPFMPDHGHPSPGKPVAKPLAEAGQYTVAPVYLFMAGLWEVTFNVTPLSGTQDAVVFRFCIDQ